MSSKGKIKNEIVHFETFSFSEFYSIIRLKISYRTKKIRIPLKAESLSYLEIDYLNQLLLFEFFKNHRRIMTSKTKCIT